MFDEHKENEANYKRKLKAYKETYLEFRYIHLLQLLRIILVLQTSINMKQVQVEKLKKFNQVHL
jgi:hypothetical protein